MNKFYFLLVIILCLQKDVNAQTIPAAQTIPYKQDFAGFATNSTVYPAGWQGWQLSASGSSANFRTTAATADLPLLASATAATTTAGVLNYNEKIGILASTTVDPSLCLVVNTTGKVNVVVTFDISTIRNPFVNPTETRKNNVELQFRVGGVSGAFTSLTGSIFRNISTAQTNGTNPQTGRRLQYILPIACENQSAVQLRWVQRDSTTTGVNRPSFAIDNVIVCPAPIVSAVVKSACAGNNGAITLNVSAGMTPYSFSWDNTNIANGPFFAVTAVTKTSHPNPSAFGTVFALDGIQGKVLDLTRGIDYTFNGTFPGHPFHITSSSIGGGAAGMVQSGTTNNLINNAPDGPLVFTPNSTHPGPPTVLYYQCNVHQQMGWKININNGGLTTQNITGLAQGKYAAAIFSADGSITTILVTVTPGSAPSVTSSSNSPLCSGSQLILQSSGGNSYLWNGPLGFVSALQNPTISNVTVSHFGPYNVTATAPNGCSTTQTANVVVLVKPSVFSFTPESGPVGTAVTVNGDNFTGINQVAIGNTTAVPVVSNDEQLQFNAPSGISSNPIKVINTIAYGCRDTSDTPFTLLTLLNLTCFIQGLYDPATDEMRATIAGGADTITISLYSSGDLDNAAFTDTKIITTNGTGTFLFPESVIGHEYYIVINHRNSMETWSKFAVLFTESTVFDFSQ